MRLKKIEQIYEKENSLIKIKASNLLLFLSIIFIFTFGVFIKQVFTESFSSYIGYLLGFLLSLFFIFLIFKGLYHLTTLLSSVLFTFAVSFGMSLGELGEYEPVFFTLIIIYVFIFSTKKTAYLISIYCIVFFNIIYYIKKQSQVFSPIFYIATLISMILFFFLSRLYQVIMENYINTITRQNESLEEDVHRRTKELEKSQKYSNLLFRNSPCAIYSVDNNGKIVDFNKKAEEITGYRREELIGKEFNLFTKSLRSDEHINNEYKIVTKKNIERVIERFSSKLQDEKGAVVGEIESFIDITNWKELEEFKADIERIIRHDLKTPLNSIIGFPKLMLTDETLSEENKEYLMIILGAGQNMLNLINASLDMYKLEVGTFQFNMIETNVLSTLKQISAELREIRKRKKCNIEILIDEEFLSENSVLNIKSEKSLFYMILNNLIKNALEASPPGKNVTVKMTHNDKLHISIHNYGAISLNIRDSFFDKHVTFGKKNGNGLGTYSAKIMAHAINADLYFETDEITGTTLNLVI